MEYITLEDLSCFVYVTFCLPNGKYYVGQHKGENKNYLGSGKLLKRAIKKYGREAFIRIIVEYCSKDKIDDKERHWIKKLESMVSQYGYNLDPGGRKSTGHKQNYYGKNNPNYGNGDKIRGNKNPAKRPYVRRKISERLKGIPKSEESKLKNRLAHIGKRHTKENRKRMSESRKGKTKKSFHVYEARSPEGDFYPRITHLSDFCRDFKLNAHCVRTCICHGRSYKGWSFTKIEDLL